MTMRKVLLFVTVAVFCTTSLAYSATHFCGKVGWYEDQIAFDCDLDIQPGIQGIELWLVHDDIVNIDGILFKSPIPDCVDWGFATMDKLINPATSLPFLTLGGADWQWSWAYQHCATGALVLAQFQGFTMSPVDCCPFPVLPAEFFGYKCSPCGEASVDWNLGVVAYLDSYGHAACPCETPPVANEESTWGSIKALYTD
jgi:hypothetical protein